MCVPRFPRCLRGWSFRAAIASVGVIESVYGLVSCRPTAPPTAPFSSAFSFAFCGITSTFERVFAFAFSFTSPCHLRGERSERCVGHRLRELAEMRRIEIESTRVALDCVRGVVVRGVAGRPPFGATGGFVLSRTPCEVVLPTNICRIDTKIGSQLRYLPKETGLVKQLVAV